MEEEVREGEIKKLRKKGEREGSIEEEALKEVEERGEEGARETEEQEEEGERRGRNEKGERKQGKEEEEEEGLRENDLGQNRISPGISTSPSLPCPSLARISQTEASPSSPTHHK